MRTVTALLVILVAVTFVEFSVAVVVARATSVSLTLALLIAISVAGAMLIKREARRSWRAFREAASTGRPPAREATDGALILLAGALLLTPGFVTDAAGLLLVLPPLRAMARRALLGWAARRLLRRGGRRDGRRG